MIISKSTHILAGGSTSSSARAWACFWPSGPLKTNGNNTGWRMPALHRGISASKDAETRSAKARKWCSGAVVLRSCCAISFHGRLRRWRERVFHLASRETCWKSYFSGCFYTGDFLSAICGTSRIKKGWWMACDCNQCVSKITVVVLFCFGQCDPAFCSVLYSWQKDASAGISGISTHSSHAAD